MKSAATDLRLLAILEGKTSDDYPTFINHVPEDLRHGMVFFDRASAEPIYTFDAKTSDDGPVFRNLLVVVCIAESFNGAWADAEAVRNWLLTHGDWSAVDDDGSVTEYTDTLPMGDIIPVSRDDGFSGLESRSLGTFSVSVSLFVMRQQVSQ